MGAFFRFLVDAKRMGKFEALWRIGYLDWVSFFFFCSGYFARICSNGVERKGKEREGGNGKRR